MQKCTHLEIAYCEFRYLDDCRCIELKRDCENKKKDKIAEYIKSWSKV